MTDLNREGLKAALAAHGENYSFEEARVVATIRAYLAHAKPDTTALVEARIEHHNGKRWHIVGRTAAGEWHMQPVGHVTADEARMICERALAALSTVPAKSAAGGDGEKPEPFCYVIEHGGFFDPISGQAEPPGIEFLPEPAPDAFPLYRTPPAPAAVEEGIDALREAIRYALDHNDLEWLRAWNEDDPAAMAELNDLLRAEASRPTSEGEA